MALSVGDIVRTSCNFVLGSGDQYQNVFHHIFDGPGGVIDSAVVSDIKDWADVMYSEYDATVDNAVIETLSFVDQVEFIDGEWKVVANIGTFTVAMTPGAAAIVLPNQSSPFVVFKTARPQSVGRKFLFPCIAASQDNGIIDGATVTLITAWAADALADITLLLANVLHPGVVRTGVNDFLPFTVAVVTNLIGSQRRRRQGSGG